MLLLLFCLPVMAEEPLVYVDAWQKSPYVFTNDDGLPDGFNVELMQKVMARLRKPYVVKLYNQQEAHEKLKKDSADISFGVSASYNSTFGSFGKETVCLFENAILVRRKDSTSVLSIEQLKKKRITVREESRAYYYLKSHGMPDSLITVVDNMEIEILREATEGCPTAVWNSMMLKWVLNKYKLTDEFTVQPVAIPAGEYRFMSNDTVLLAKLDSVCRLMKEEGEVDRLINKWMYPEKPDEDNTLVGNLLLMIMGISVIIILLIFIHNYRKKKINDHLQEVNSLMHLMLSANDIMVWVYYPLTRRYAWMTRDGKVEKYYTSYEFSKYFPSKDFNIIHSNVMELLSHEAQPVDLRLHTYDIKEMKKKLVVDVHIESLRDDYGKIYLICGAQHNITDSKASLDRLRLLHARYQTAFNIALGAILRFDADGMLIDINERCCQKLGVDNRQKVLDMKVNIHDFGVFDDIDLDNCSDDLKFCAHLGRTRLSDYIPVLRDKNGNPTLENYMLDGYYYTHLHKSYDQDGHLLGYMMYFREITEDTEVDGHLTRKKNQVERLNSEADNVMEHRNKILQSAGIWMMSYFPAEKKLEIFESSTGRVMSFAQLDILELVASKDMKRVFKIFHKVDAYERTDIHVNVATLMRNTNHQLKHFDIDVHPVYNKKGEVASYFGIIKDITEHLMVSEELKLETKMAREAEHLKQNFLKNMSYSIRQPLVAMQQSIDMLSQGLPADQEMQMLNTVTSNTRRLIMLSDDTLFLSRIEAGLQTEQKEEADFVVLFKETVNSVINEYHTDAVHYSINDLYQTLPVNIDKRIVSRIIKETVSLSARYTHFGTINVRYMYRKGIMNIAVEDTGQGIPPSTLQTIFEPRIGDTYTTEAQNKHLSGLEMPICKALVDMLNGSIEIESNPGRGTTIYVSIPIEESKSKGQSIQVS